MTQRNKQPLKELNEYQVFTISTAIYPDDMEIIYPTLGLAGEVGEVADKVKKVCRDNNKQFDDEHRQEIAKELGDVLWYVAALAADLGFTLQEIAEINVKKLSSRKERNVLHGEGDNR